MRDGFFSHQIHHANLVRAVTVVKDGSKSSAWMHCDVGWEIAQFDLPAGRPQRPLIGQ